MANEVKFLFGTQARYDAIGANGGTYDDNAFYKITDNGNVYIGARKITGVNISEVGTTEIQDGSIKLEDLSPEVIAAMGSGGASANGDDINNLF